MHGYRMLAKIQTRAREQSENPPNGEYWAYIGINSSAKNIKVVFPWLTLCFNNG